MAKCTPLLLVTANVGSIFENPDVMLDLWIQEFLRVVSNSGAKFVALHCQEVGGKNYEIRMQYVQKFIQLLTSSNELQPFDKMEIFIDEDFSHAESFTALGNFYFIHEDISDVKIWNFEQLKLVPFRGKNVHAGNIEGVPTKEKSKFPQNFFPECKWSRKGYLRTRWSLNGTIFDLVNIHLFHDASNFIAMQTFPSVYTVMRQKALQYTLNRFYTYEDGAAPFFLFGDFNFRTNTQGVIRKLVTGLNEHKDDNSNESPKLQYKDEASEVIFTVGKKEFNHADHQNVFICNSGEWLKEFDRELDTFNGQLYEFPIKFAPSYPYEENSDIACEYMKTRCPAWCDRVLLSMNAKQLISQDDETNGVKYGIIGNDICMGDHKPVYLQLNLINDTGTVITELPFKSLCSACKIASSLYKPLFITNACSSQNMISSSRNSDVKRYLRSGFRSIDPVYRPNKLSIVEFPNDLISSSVKCQRYSEPTESSNNIVDNNENNINGTYIKNESVDNLTKMMANVEVHDPYDKFSDRFSTSDDLTRVKRVHSASLVNNELTYTQKANLCVKCKRETGRRIRSASVSDKLLSWYSSSRVRLKSDPELKISLPRIESHHSSSDEEWFEEIEETTDVVSSENDDKNDEIIMIHDLKNDRIDSIEEGFPDISSHLVNESCITDDVESIKISLPPRESILCFCFPKKKSFFHKKLLKRNKTNTNESSGKWYSRRRNKSLPMRSFCIVS